VNHDDAVDEVNRWRERRRKIRRYKRKAKRCLYGAALAVLTTVEIWTEEIDDQSHE